MNNVQSLKQVVNGLQSRGYVESLAWVGNHFRMGSEVLNPEQVRINASYEVEEASTSKVYALITDAGEQGYLIDLGGKFEQYLSN